MSLQKYVAALALTLGLSAGARADLQIVSTTFGWDPKTDTVPIVGTTPQAAYPSMSVNQPLEIEFDSSLKKGSIEPSTVIITSVPASVLAPQGLSSSIPGGLTAPVFLKVNGSKLRILPAVLPSGNTISFGFAPNAYYLLELRGKKKGIKGSDGDTLKSSVFIQFRTTSEVADPNPGPPQGTVMVIDPKKGKKVKLKKTSAQEPKPSFKKVVPNPSPELQIRFDELVLPSTLLNAATGGSPTLAVELDVDGDGATNDRVTVPGTFTVTHTNNKTIVDWHSTLQGIPQNRLYVVRIRPLVQDLVGNAEFDGIGEIPDDTYFAFRTKPAEEIPLLPIVETFASTIHRDTDATSADWAEGAPGFLRNGVGGGTGEDGPFIATTDTSLATGVFDPELGQEVQKIWNFNRFQIDQDVTVTATGEFPLIVRCSGPVEISGTLDLSGTPGEIFSATQIAPGLGGAGDLGGSPGGRGGSVTDGVALDTPLFATVAGYATPLQANQGLSGRAGAVTSFTLQLENGSQQVGSALSGLWVQPNVGTGSSLGTASPGSAILHNHPTFVIESVTPPLSMSVVDDPTSALYFGPLNQPGLDLYELPPPPIAKAGDPVIMGDLAGHPGTASGFPWGGGGRSLPLTVAQSFITQVRSGGGGGGSGRFPGSSGENSPTAGLSGEHTGTAGGAGAPGVVNAGVQSATATVITLTGNLPSTVDFTPPDAEPFIVFPNTTGGAYFAIASTTATTITIVPLELTQETPADTDANGVLDLLDVTVGATCRIEPALSIGGSGGGGSGVHLGGTLKFGAPPNLTLPTWTPGAGGGAGGGAASIESAKPINVLGSGSILVRGGGGGRTSGPVASSASGGGGGGGGTLRLASASTSTFAVRVEGLVDVRGGEGGVGFVEGGKGGDGRVRFESFSGNLSAANYPTTQVQPSILATDLGHFLPGFAPSVGQSDWFWTQSLTASYTDFTITYNATVDGVPETGLTFTYADFLNGVEPPFDLTFNDALINSSGGIDQDSVDEVFTTDISTLSGPFIRFRFVLEGEVQVGGKTYTQVAIDTLVVEVSA